MVVIFSNVCSLYFVALLGYCYSPTVINMTFYEQFLVVYNMLCIFVLIFGSPTWRRQWRYMHSEKNWMGALGSLPKTLTLFTILPCDLLIPIYDLTLNQDSNTCLAIQSCSCLVQTNVNPFTPKSDLIDFTLSNANRFYSV